MSGGISVPSQLFGYDVVDLIGCGAGSQVYAVSEPGTGQLYVLKHVTVREAKQERFVQQLETLSSTVGSEAWNSRDLKSRPH